MNVDKLSGLAVLHVTQRCWCGNNVHYGPGSVCKLKFTI